MKKAAHAQKARVLCSRFRIHRENKQRVADILFQMLRDGVPAGMIMPHTLKPTNDLKTLFYWLRWNITLDAKNGDVDSIWFVPDSIGHDGYGADEILFKAIAPWVVSGSFVSVVMGDNTFLKWKFENGQVQEIPGQVVFQDEVVSFNL